MKMVSFLSVRRSDSSLQSGVIINTVTNTTYPYECGYDIPQPFTLMRPQVHLLALITLSWCPGNATTSPFCYNIPDSALCSGWSHVLFFLFFLVLLMFALQLSIPTIMIHNHAQQ